MHVKCQLNCLASNKSVDLERFTITSVMFGAMTAAVAEARKSRNMEAMAGWLAG